MSLIRQLQVSLDAVIDSWRNDVLNGIVTQLSADGTPVQRLQAFGEQILCDKVDPAMRVWAKSHGNFADIRPMDGDAFNLHPADASTNLLKSNYNHKYLASSEN